MITKWFLQNFKSVASPTELSLAGLTVLAGANSSGKSTLIQSMLLIAQTLANQVSTRNFILNGPMTRLGTYSDIKTFGNDGVISLGWEITMPNPQRRHYIPSAGRISKFRFTVTFGESLTDKRDVAQLNPELRMLKLDAWDERDREDPATVTIERYAGGIGERARELGIQLASESAPSQLEKGLLYTVQLGDTATDRHRREVSRSEVVGCVMRHFVPITFVRRLDRIDAIMSRLCAQPQDWSRYVYDYSGNELILGERVVAYLASILTVEQRRQLSLPDTNAGPFPKITLWDWFSRLQRVNPAGRSSMSETFLRSREYITDVVRMDGAPFQLTGDNSGFPVFDISGYMNDEFSESLRYLGPLREEPKSIHPLGLATDPRSVGLKGEHAAAVFNISKDDRVRYIRPAAVQDGSYVVVSASLREAVFDWLHYMQLAESVDAEDRGKLGHELSVTLAGTDRPHDLTHVGVGVSQVFPIIVMALSAEAGSVLIFEQPELHLHPWVQAALGDFFLAVVASGVQCVIETHSEYLINRIRLRVAESASGQLDNAQVMYFVEKKDGETAFRRVEINRFGAVVDWPAGFFDTSLLDSERLIAAAWRKRELEKRARPSLIQK